jgi:hypothetical protein
LSIRAVILAAAGLLFLPSCVTTPPPGAEPAQLTAFSQELGKHFTDLENVYQLAPPASGFNEGRNLSRLPAAYSLAGLPFEAVLVFDQPGRLGRLRGVEGLYRHDGAGQAPAYQAYQARILEALSSLWGPPHSSDSQSWSWDLENFTASLLASPAEGAGGRLTWLFSLEEKTARPLSRSAQVLSTLGGWDQALFGSSLAGLEGTYSLSQLGRSRLNDKPASMVENEISYLGHPFKAAFFFDRFTPQASLVGVDLYLLEDKEPEQWRQKRQAMLETLSKLYGKPSASKEGHRFIWAWKDSKGSLTFTDTSRNSRTTWLLSFRPAPGRVTPPPALAAPRTPQDIAGWANVRFGMSPAQMELLYTGQNPAFAALAGSGYGFANTLQFEDLDFKVLFLFDRQSRPPRLSQVVLSRQASEEESDSLEKRLNLMNMLTAWYGPPSQDLLEAKGGGKAIWLRPSGSLEFHDMPEIKTWVLNYRSIVD